MSELWNGISYGEQALQVIAIFVAIVGLLGMLMSLYTSLNERRREIAILGALSVAPLKVISLLVFESGLLILNRRLFRSAVVYGSIMLLQPIMEQHATP